MGEAVRSAILRFDRLDVRAETFLFLAARAHHFHAEILPFLEDGGVVLCDRFMDSTVAYQHGGHGLPLEAVDAMNRFALEGRKPDLTLLIDLDPETASARIAKRDMEQTRFETAPLEFRNRVREAYLEIAKREPGRVKTIDGKLSIGDAAERVWEQIEAAVGGGEDP